MITEYHNETIVKISERHNCSIQISAATPLPPEIGSKLNENYNETYEIKWKKAMKQKGVTVLNCFSLFINID